MLWPNRTFVNTPDTPLGSACGPPLGACFLRLFPAILHWPQRYLTEAVHLRSWESRRSPSVHSQEEACSLAQKNVARGGSHRLPVVPLFPSFLFLYPAVVRLLRWYASASALDPLAVHWPGPPFVGRLPPPHGSAGCFHAVRICRRFWWPALACW